MALFSLTDEWTIELGEEFERRVEDGSLVFSHEDRAVWVDLFEDHRPIPQKMKMLRDDAPQDAKSWTFELEGLLKFAYLERDEENENYELTSLCAVATGYALMIFYFDDDEFLAWALGCWKSVRFEADA
ncbi:hypothetical protein B1R32_1092 [Abditibacterium utsteinense]|uniref:Uncharacterized protein n=1 Tax=Abditibacterium utsteinense TaxID=1960156 RepID=A0A2S8SS76_9BACT|nr:hypothetical protein [Abditibacterium utsteinense]PQV63663.1 hypothetical protein B1R32_1092 [Abditibacterium utsteinense]